MNSSPDVAIEVSGISKTFAGHTVLTNFAMSIDRGEIRGLVGQNGSGKSTLIKILDGYHSPDDGACGSAGGHPLPFSSHTGMRSRGLRFIHQDMGLVDEMSIIDNLALSYGYDMSRWGISWRRERSRAMERLETVGLGSIDPTKTVGSLAPVEKALVAIARALDDVSATSLLVLDEPTASLPREEVEQLFSAIRGVAAAGGAVLYVSHRIDEVVTLTDRVTVLRDGHEVCTVDTASVDHEGLIELIIGSKIDSLVNLREHASVGDVVLEVAGLSAARLDEVSLQVRAGETVGVTGLAGSGAFELASCIFGASPRTAGRVSVSGTEIPAGSPRTSVRSRVAYVPPDRQANSNLNDFDMRENLTLPRIDAARFGGLPWISTRREVRDAESWMTALDVRPPLASRKPGTFSGGNQQKAILARWFRTRPKVILLDEPAHGVDVGAKQVIFSKLADAARDGAAVVVCSADIDDLVALCDRVVVVRDGRIATELTGASITTTRILQESIASQAKES